MDSLLWIVPLSLVLVGLALWAFFWAVGDGQFDVLNITGDATLGGTLEVHMLNGFLPKAGDSIDFLRVTGNVTGDFAQVTFLERHLYLGQEPPTKIKLSSLLKN